MEELITRIVEKVGIDAATAERVVGIILGMFKDNASSEQLSGLLGAMPGAEDLIAKASDAGDSAGAAAGGIGGMLSGAMSAMGGGNPLMDTLGKLQGEGLSMDQARSAGSELVAFARESAGDDVVNSALEAIPGLKDML